MGSGRAAGAADRRRECGAPDTKLMSSMPATLIRSRARFFQDRQRGFHETMVSEPSAACCRAAASSCGGACRRQTSATAASRGSEGMRARRAITGRRRRVPPGRRCRWAGMGGAQAADAFAMRYDQDVRAYLAPPTHLGWPRSRNSCDPALSRTGLGSSRGNHMTAIGAAKDTLLFVLGHQPRSAGYQCSG
jgi:hypothetical protein